jgi:hypothetical protein
MLTAWTQGLLDEARSLTERRNYLSALKKLLVVLDVYPAEPAALAIACHVAREGSRRSTNANPGEVILPEHLYDSRLNAIFCSCDAPGCQVSWVSAHFLATGSETVMIANPLGASCHNCGITLCRNHLPPAGSGLQIWCPQCRQAMNTAPRPNGRPTTNQTPRLNKPLVHVIVVVEGKRDPDPDFLTELCRHVVPDVFEDSPRIDAKAQRRFTDDGTEAGLTLALAYNAAYAGAGYELQTYPGQQAGRKGQRWIIVKVFENRPKHGDPGY